MADAPFQQLLDEMRARIQAELDGQIEAIRMREAEAARTREAEAAGRTRQEAEADAEKRWAAKVDAVKAEWAARLQSEVSAARSEAEKRLVGESMRLRSEAEQALADARQRAAEELEAERRRAGQELHDAREAFDADRKHFEERAAATLPELEPASLLGAMREIDQARSLTEALSALARGAAGLASRAAVFTVSGARLEEWPSPGVPALAREPIDLDRGGLLQAAVAGGARVASSRDDHALMAPFAALPEDAQAIAVPLLLGGQAVAVLYADDNRAEGRSPGPDWMESLELLARHAAACLAQLTASTALRALQGDGRAAAHPGAPDDEQSARRYAKLLVSEIKLYNEGAVRVGREKRDLLHRLRAEIERAQHLYEERVPPSVSGRALLFQQELVNTLAGGDAALLGS